MSTVEIRINARLTGEDARRFKELQTREKQSASYVIREAVREYHAKRVAPRRSAYEIMLESGFIGSIKNGARDSSSEESIHRAMDEVLRSKYPHAFEHPASAVRTRIARPRKAK